MTKRLETVEAVIKTLYGRPADAARALGRSRSAIWKYMGREQFSGDVYEPIQTAARLAGCEVADELFTPVSVHPRMIRQGA
jgi:hypothetical protein